MTATRPAAASDAVLLCHCACPDEVCAHLIARALVNESLAACVNCVPGVLSTYRWQGQVETAREVLLLIKTTSAQLSALTARVLTLHPYDLPELIAVTVCDGHDAYLAWVRESVRLHPASPKDKASDGS